jgi:acetyltransferase-like isoleucine patch superfamily enzyme
MIYKNKDFRDVYYVVGAGGHGREVSWLLNLCGIEDCDVRFLDDGKDVGSNINGVEVAGGIESVCDDNCCIMYVAGIGFPVPRYNVCSKIGLDSNRWVNVIGGEDFYCFDWGKVRGNVAFHQSVFSGNILIGDFNLFHINTFVGRGCRIGSFCSMYPGSSIEDGSSIGDMTDIGTGSVIRPGVKIGNNVTIAASSIIEQDIKDNVIVFEINGRLKTVSKN